jgi:hypothetical protein
MRIFLVYNPPVPLTRRNLLTGLIATTAAASLTKLSSAEEVWRPWICPHGQRSRQDGSQAGQM